MCREGTSPVLRREGSRKAPDLSDYNAHLLDVLHQQKLAIWLESSLQIKQAGGMQRGKTDKVDAQPVRRCGIAQYAYGTGHPALSRPNAPLGATTRGYPKTGLSERDPPAA